EDLAGTGALSGDHGPVPLGIPLLDPPTVAVVRHVEVARCVYCDGGRTVNLAEGWRDNHRPVPLSVPLLDPAAIRDLEVARGIHRECIGTVHLAGSVASRGDHGPAPLGIPLLDSVAAAAAGAMPLRDVEVARCIHCEGPRIPCELAGVVASRGNHR